MNDVYISGHWEQGMDTSFNSLNPATGETLWTGNKASKAQIHRAVASAKGALKSWSKSSLADRAKCMVNFATILRNRKDELTRLISLETGKPKWESATEVSSVIAKIALSIQAYEERCPQKETQTPDARGMLRYKPYGVIVVLGPFNFPAHLANGHIVPALLAGNTVVYKPSELTPAVAQYMVQCLHDAGLPPGVLNCVQGDKDCAALLLEEDIQGVYFTGSYHTGLKINQSFASRPEVILALEMGGNNPLVITHIKDVKVALYQTLISSFITAGQRCSCARRVIIEDSYFGDDFLTKLISLGQNLKIGAFSENPEPFMGPVIRLNHAINHLKSQDALIASGGKALLTMSLMREGLPFLTPGIIEMSKVSNPKDEEIFAPLIQIYRYKTLDDAIQLCNQTKYGLAAALFSDDSAQFEQFYQEVKAGLINWNRPTTGAASNLPFGGIGFSGNHRPSAYFAADYCAYPIASLERNELILPESLVPGILLND